jgi:hypothetical protein
MSFRLDRRTVLRGMGGAAVALPALEIMGTGKARAAAAKRFVMSYGGASIGARGIGDVVTPTKVGPDYDVKPGLKSLTDLKIREDVSVVSGLVIPWTRTDDEAIPPGGKNRSFHYNTLGPQMAGTATAQKSGPGSGNPRGPTVDQVVADRIGDNTTHKSLIYRVQASFAGSSVSWKAGPGGDVQRVAPVVSPRLAYESLMFPSSGGGAPVDTKRVELLLKQRRSVLDFVMADSSSLGVDLKLT